MRNNIELTTPLLTKPENWTTGGEPSPFEPRVKFLFTPRTYTAEYKPERKYRPDILIMSGPRLLFADIKFTSEIDKEFQKPFNYLQLLPVIERNVWELLRKDLRFIRPLYNFVNEIDEYFKMASNSYKIGVTLQEDPEDPEFKAFVIVIKAKFSNLNEKLQLEDKIGGLLDSLTDRLAKLEGEEMRDLLSNITYFIEEI